MSLVCAHCAGELSWWAMKGSFECPECKRPLIANVTGPWIATIVLWSLAEVALFAFFPTSDGTAGLAFVAARALASFGIGVAIGRVVFGSFCTVSAGARGVQS
jgi:hypothetical protein